MSNESITLISLVLLVLVAILYNRIHNTPQKKANQVEGSSGEFKGKFKRM